MNVMLATRRIVAPADTIVVDHGGRSFWIEGRENPKVRAANSLGISLIRLGPTNFRYLAALIVAAPRLVTIGELFDAIWGDDRNGGPESVEKYLGKITWSCRPVLTWVGARVSCVYGFGRRLEFLPRDTKVAA